MKIAVFNNKSTTEDDVNHLLNCIDPEETKGKQTIGACMKFFCKFNSSLLNLFCVTMIWILCLFNFFLMGFMQKYLKGDIFINTGAASLA